MGLDVGVRVDASNDTIRVDVVGDDLPTRVVTLTHGLYTCTRALVEHLEAALQSVVSGALSASLGTDGRVTIGWTGGASGTVEWLRPSLRDALGFSGSSTTGTGGITGASVARGVLVARLPWSDPRPLGWALRLARADSWRGTGRSAVLVRRRVWAVTMRLRHDEIEHARGVMRQLLRGLPARWYRDASITDTAWSFTAPSGYVDVWLSPESRAYAERWMTTPSRLACEVEIELAEVVS